MTEREQWLEDRWREHAFVARRMGKDAGNRTLFDEKWIAVWEANKDLPALPHKELFAMDHAEQWLGCAACKESHHASAFCLTCGRCFFKAEKFQNTEFGDFVTCQCGVTDLWD